MKYKWFSTSTAGVRYREHPTRTHGKKKDRYYVIRYRKEGKTIQEPIGWASNEGITQAIATERLAEIKRNIRKGEGPQSLREKREIAEKKRIEKEKEKKREQKDALSFGDFFTDTYITTAETNKPEKTIKKEKGHFENWLKPILGKIPLKKIRPLHLERIKKNMIDAGKSARTIQHVFATFRQCWNHAKINGLVYTDTPTRQVKIPPINNDRQRFLTYQESDDLLKELKSKSKQLYQMAFLSLHCGLRASEIFNLHWKDIDVRRGLLTLWNTKNGETGFAYMTGDIKKMFEAMKKGKPDELVFKGYGGKKITEISNSFKRAVDKLKMNDGITDRRQKIVFHSLRHTYASRLVLSGVSLYTVQKLMRHSNLKMTERYSHLNDETLQAAVKQMEQQQQKAQVISITKEKENK